jgi:hypothetical protein
MVGGASGAGFADTHRTATELVSQMTLEEKALLLSGDGWWRTHHVDRLQIPSICMTDGPHGLRKVVGEGLGLSTSVPATCFPTASALASSWDTGLIRQVGTALAEEAQASDVQILPSGLPCLSVRKRAKYSGCWPRGLPRTLKQNHAAVQSLLASFRCPYPPAPLSKRRPWPA